MSNGFGLRPLIFRFDAYLCRRTGVFEFTSDQNCILRLQQTVAAHDLTLPGCVLPAGSPVIQIHLWNEHIPAIAKAGPDVAWAAHTWRLFYRSLRLASGYIQASPALAHARAIGGETAVFTPGPQDSGAKFFDQLGFIVSPYHRPLGRFGEFWENFYSWWIMWAYNPASLKGVNMIRMQRSEIWMETGAFLARFGGKVQI